MLRLLAVAGVNFLHYVPAVGDFAEWSEAHAVETLVVYEIDEELRGARVGAGGGEGQRLRRVRSLSARIVLDGGFVPRGVYLWIGAQAKLHDESRNDAEECAAVVEMMLAEIIEAIHSERRLGTGDVDGEIAGRGFEFYLESFGGLRFQGGGTYNAGSGPDFVVFATAVAGFFAGARLDAGV